MKYTNIKYILEPYKPGAANKHTCPYCHKPKCFVRYINKDTGDYLNEYCGRCDHEQSCQQHYTPSQYFHDHPDDKPKAVLHKPQPIIKPATPKIYTIDKVHAAQSRSNDSVFMDWLKQKVNNPDAINRICNQYLIGATPKREVIFWQIDVTKRIRTGKIMAYNPDGHRTGYPNWVHSQLIKQGLLPPEWTLSQCLFGEHLLSFYPHRQVCLVESEKTALLLSALTKDLIWLATGGCSQLNPDKLKVLRGRIVTVIPDSGVYDKWSAIMAQTTGIDYQVTTELEQYPPNTDLADII